MFTCVFSVFNSHQFEMLIVGQVFFMALHKHVFANEEFCFLRREQKRSLLLLFILFKFWFSVLDSKQSSVYDAVGVERVPFQLDPQYSNLNNKPINNKNHLYLCICIFCPNSTFLFIPLSVVTLHKPLFASFSPLFVPEQSHILQGSKSCWSKSRARIKKHVNKTKTQKHDYII